MDLLSEHYLLLELVKQGLLLPLTSDDAQQKAHSANQEWLERIQAQPVSFLRDYDLLFRKVTDELINKGYDFSMKHPHQTLRKILIKYSAPTDEIDNMISCRHALKYHRIEHANPAAIVTLQKLLQTTVFKTQVYAFPPFRL